MWSMTAPSVQKEIPATHAYGFAQLYPALLPHRFLHVFRGLFGLHPGPILPGQTTAWMLPGLHLDGALETCLGQARHPPPGHQKWPPGYSTLLPGLNQYSNALFVLFFICCSHLILFFCLSHHQDIKVWPKHLPMFPYKIISVPELYVWIVVK
jgi:hypothetical protein